MALKGTLKDFAIGDIFQLIGHQQKSGSLYITNKDQVAHIMFDTGNVVIARFKQSNPELMLGNLLLKAQIISEEQLEEAIQDQQVTLRSIGDILLAKKAVTIETLKEFIVLQMKEVLFRVFQWRDGLYEFITEDFKFNQSIITPQRAEQILLDGFRMLDEWPAILKKVSALTAIYKPLIDVNEVLRCEEISREVSIDNEIDTAFAEFEESSPGTPVPKTDKPQYTKNQIKVLALVDGYRTVKEVVSLSRLGTFDTCQVLAELIDKSIITKIDSTAESRLDAESAFEPLLINKKQKVLRIVTDLIILALIIAIVPSLMFYFSSNTESKSDVKNFFYVNTARDPLTEYADTNRLEQIKFALELYRLKKYSYPDNLKELVFEKLLREEVLKSNYYFRKTGDTYNLLP